MPSRFALLVGVDHYLNNGSRGSEISLNDLEGCVNDAEAFRVFLQRTYNFDKISVLLSPLQANHPYNAVPTLLPTFANIKSQFNSIASQTKAGDLFFFHFSGHGALLNRTSKSPKGSTKDPSLMTADYCDGMPALRGWQLDRWLKRLDQKKVQVVVSLDSCYTGGAWRGGGRGVVGFRTPDRWPSSVPNSDKDEQSAKYEDSDDDLQPAARNALLEPSWHINPRALTLMTACEANQKAAEVRGRDGKVGGAFTCGLLEYLEASDFQVSYRMARDHLQTTLDPQKPTCFGYDRFHFLGNSEFLGANPIAFRYEGGRIHINAGLAHGICLRSEFVLFPISKTTITIDMVEEFKSSATASEEIEEALRQHESKMVIPSRLCLGDATTFHVAVDPDLGIEFQDFLLKILGIRIANDINITDLASGDEKVFKIQNGHAGINIIGPEQVIGYSGPVRGLSLGHAAYNTSPDVLAAEVVAPLLHLARLKHILDLKPEDTSGQPPFEVSMLPKDGTSAAETYRIGQTFTYEFRNTGDVTLYIAVLNITPEFQIWQVAPSNDSLREVKPGQSINYEFTITLPDPLPEGLKHEIRHSNRRDIFRTLVSTQNVSTWKALELPAIWDADKVDRPDSRRRLRDAVVESHGRWWVRDTHINTTDRKTYPISGIPKDPSCNALPIRQDIDDWYREQTSNEGNRIQLTLFTEALTAIQQRPLTDERSYFRLAGIHGAPWIDWDGSSPPTDENNKPTDFCVHNDYTFPTWHRVYIALYEQVIYEAMIGFIDNQISVSDERMIIWKTEAKRWRLPYWDFARFASRYGAEQDDELRLPILVTLPTVKIRVFGTTNETVNKANPLYKFQTQILMGDLDSPYAITSLHTTENGREVDIPFDKCLATTKYGLLEGYDPDVWADAGQNWLRANLALNEHPWYQNMDGWDSVPNLQDMTYRLLKTPLDNWGNFSTTRYYENEDQPKNWMNIEAIHNNVHNWVGGFMFSRPGEDNLKLWGAGHMANIPVAAFDPIFWLHHCNIDRLTAIWQCLNPEKWFDDVKSMQSRGNALQPFHRDTEGLVFKSDDVRDWNVFNYEYAITKDHDDLDKINERLEDLYGKRTKDLYKKHGNEDYILNIKYDRFAFGGNPFQINIFFGPVDRKDFYDSKSKNFVGSVFNFSSNLQYSRCSNCIEQQAQGVMAVSQLPATLAFHYYQNEHRGTPTPSYVVVDSQGKSVDIEVDIHLYWANTSFFDGGGGANYVPISKGVPAEVDY